jgi:hypothetical protein
MRKPTYGQLTNPAAWRETLPPPLFDALTGWVRGQPFNLTHRRWLHGDSGSFVVLVRLHPDRGAICDRILKMLRPAIAEAGSRGVGLAHQHSPREFRDLHLVSTTMTGQLAGTEWWLHVQEVAQGDLSRLLPLADLIDDPRSALLPRHLDLAGYRLEPGARPEAADRHSRRFSH